MGAERGGKGGDHVNDVMKCSNCSYSSLLEHRCSFNRVETGGGGRGGGRRFITLVLIYLHMVHCVCLHATREGKKTENSNYKGINHNPAVT